MMRCRNDRTLEGMTPAEAAAHWLVRLDGDEVTAAEEAAFDAWLSNSEANRAAYARACEAWEAVDQDALDPTVQALRISVLAGRRPKRRPPMAQVAAIAAALVLSIGLGVVAVDGPGVAAWMAGETRYATDVGERLDIVLADGTSLTLNTDSRLAVRYRGDRREVRMDRGQAYFDVAHDPSRPFSVEGGGRRVTALGTRFEVRVDPHAFSTTLLEGSIVVDPLRTAADAAPKRMVLEPGETLTARPGRKAVVATRATSAAPAWREGLIEFNDESLAAAVAELNRYNRHPIRLRDERLRTLSVSGVFKAGRPEGFMEAMSALYPVQVVDRGETIDVYWKDTAD
ncbi:FecR family protein [Brevundimonas faecalis]|uniref:FecR family protein n=1 Tax=Brevundimonas faecalis TaxID=947378 RepID=UPI00360D8277